MDSSAASSFLIEICIHSDLSAGTPFAAMLIQNPKWFERNIKIYELMIHWLISDALLIKMNPTKIFIVIVIVIVIVQVQGPPISLQGSNDGCCWVLLTQLLAEFGQRLFCLLRFSFVQRLFPSHIYQPICCWRGPSLLFACSEFYPNYQLPISPLISNLCG